MADIRPGALPRVAPAPTPTPADWRMLAVALTATFMASFDLFVVNVATEALRADLRASDAALELVVSGYAFAYAAGLITGGRLGDRYGYRRTFVLGMAAFTVTSLLCGLARDPGQLVVARLAQGLSAAVMVPQVLSLVTARFPAAHRGRATAWYGAANGLGSIAGQLLGGVLLQADVYGLGWRAVFLVNVPVGAAATLLALRVLPQLTRGKAAFDILGALSVTATLTLLLIPLTLGREARWPLWTWLCLAAVVPAGWVTVRRQRALRSRGGRPVLDPDLFRNRPYVTLVAAVGLFQLYFAAYMFTLALLLQAGLGLDPLTAALAFLPQAVLFSAGSLASGRLTARFGRAAPGAGGALVAAGLTSLIAQLALNGTHMAAWTLLPALASIGLGNGLLLPPLIGAALTRVAPSAAGAASGLVNTVQQASGSLGVALLGMLFFARSGPGLRTADSGMVAVCCVFVGLVGTSAALLLRSQKPRQADRSGIIAAK